MSNEFTSKNLTRKILGKSVGKNDAEAVYYLNGNIEFCALRIEMFE